MEETFKQLRQINRRPDIQSFADALFNGRAPFAPPREEKCPARPLEAFKTQEAQKKDEAVPEQQKTLESLKRFTQEMAEKQGEAKIKFPGGEIGSKPSEENQFYEVDINSPQNSSELAFKDLAFDGHVQVLFLGEKNDDEQVAMLTRMINAMKLSSDSDVLRVPLNDELDLNETQTYREQFRAVAEAIYLAQPKVIIPLGGKAVSLLFGKKRRLSQVRGKFYSLTLKFKDEKSVETQMIPIFHPEYLLANPGMKRTAWEDLQKIMKHLGVL